MKLAELSCLNDPARAMSRVELLRSLHRAGINPFDVYRADEMPEPKRFPVFLRHEDSHYAPKPSLLADQGELDAALADMQRNSQPLRGVLIVEHCPAPFGRAPGDGSGVSLWHKWGTFCIGGRMSVDHIAVDNNWFVKVGSWDLLNDAVVAAEHEAVTTNQFAADVKEAFDVAGIEFGRADHGTVNGRTVIYEINTNPFIGRYVPDKIALRFQNQKLGRERLAAALTAIDCKESGTRRLKRCKWFRSERLWSFGLRVALRH
jgi:hypothetical protein